MSDVFTRRKRSEVMSRIRGRGNRGTELALLRLLRRLRITGWRRHLKIGGQKAEGGRQKAEGSNQRSEIRTRKSEIRNCPVRPDFVFPRLKVAVFVDGCFWHGCPRHGTWPARRAAWWRRKLEGNRARDRRVNRTLRRAGWRVVRIWEHEFTRKNEARLVGRLRRVIRNG